jgi:hypothetical protein
MPYIVLDSAVAAAAPVVTKGAPLVSVGETLASLRSELKKMLAGRTDVDLPRLNLWINFAYQDLASSLEIDDLKSAYGFPTVAGQPLYQVPAVVGSTRSAALIDPVNSPIYGGRPLMKTDVDNYYREENRSDYPQKYFREAGLIVLYPTPDQAYTVALNFWIRPANLVNETDSPILAYEWHEAILLMARAKAFSALLEFEAAQAAQNDYVNLIRRKVDRTQREDEGRIITSSVPRRRSQLTRNRRQSGMEPGDGLP